MNRSNREIYVVGVGMHPFRPPSQVPYTELGLAAVRAALDDGGVNWSDVDSAYIGTALVGAAVGVPMLRHLGSSPLSVTQVENASASGSSAVRLAYLDVLSGASDVSLVVGVDKPSARPDGFQASGMVDMLGELMTPAAHFALRAERYLAQTGGTPADLAHVSVKNHRNGLLNDNAQRRESLSLEMVLASAAIAGPLTKYQCCPIGEGAAAVIVASEAAIARLRLDRHRAVRIAASVSMSEELYEPDVFPDAELTRRATERALQQAGLTAEELDVVEVHDAFSIEELMYVEAIGLSKPGSAISDLKRGDFDIGGRCAVSASGGLQSMGHPVGPTGVAQLVEIATQLRGEAGPRQQPGARVGLAHMLGLGAVCIEHVLVSGNSSAVDEPDDDTTGHLP